MTFERWLQSRLTSHGYPVGGIDGVVGPTTRAAIKKFQVSRGIPATGKADEKTVAALRSTSVGSVSVDRSPAPGAASPRVPSLFPTQAGVTAFYGNVGTSQTLVVPPWTMRLAWDKRRTIKRMSLHEKCAESAVRSMEDALSEYGLDGIKLLGLDLFGGSLNVRRMRGGTAYSMHSWGIAIDFDPERNALRAHHPDARLSLPDARGWWACWERRGWTSLGRARDFDWMHVQAARLS